MSSSASMVQQSCLSRWPLGTGNSSYLPLADRRPPHLLTRTTSLSLAAYHPLFFPPTKPRPPPRRASRPQIRPLGHGQRIESRETREPGEQSLELRDLTRVTAGGCHNGRRFRSDLKMMRTGLGFRTRRTGRRRRSYTRTNLARSQWPCRDFLLA